MAGFDKLKISLIGLVGATFLRLLNASIRWENQGKLADPHFWQKIDHGIFAFWHGRQLLMSFAKLDFKGEKPLYVLISKHADGRMISEAINRLGLPSVAGSSSRGGQQAARELLEVLGNKGHIGITPDGPRGPAQQSKKGVIFLASQSGKMIYPITLSAQKFWQFKSWDKMILPKPFSRGVRIFGEPISVPAELTEQQVEEYRKLLDQRLSKLTEEADNYRYS